MALSVSVITLSFLLMLTELIVVTELPPPVVSTLHEPSRASGPVPSAHHFIGVRFRTGPATLRSHGVGPPLTR